MRDRVALFAVPLLFLTSALAVASEPAATETAAAETADSTLSTPDAGADAMNEPHPRWGLSSSLGFGGTGGDFGNLLQDPVAGDLSIFRNKGKWRFGFGLSFTSFTMPPPYEDEDEWGFQQTYLFATRMLRDQGAVRPYIQLRGGLARLHPRSELFAFEPPPENAGDSPTSPANGFSVGLVPGVEVQLNKSLALDISGLFNWYSVSEYDLSPVGY